MSSHKQLEENVEMGNIETGNLNSAADDVDDRWSAVWDLNSVFIMKDHTVFLFRCITLHVT